jgi:hypothetical protein
VHVMAKATPNFFDVWGNDKTRNVLLSHLDCESLCNLRLAHSECCRLATSTLFMRTRLTFTPSALTKPSRLEALARIGHHIQHLTFSMPHNDATFLAPLINPVNGREITFLYTPHTSVISEIHRPKYGTQELGDVLTQQYPPIFHAATNVSAFIRTLQCMPKLRHLTVTCPGQDPTQRYRRDAVDYALISLRIAIERTNLPKLSKLSLNIHPSALLYFRAQPGFGSSPAAARRWKQIRKLKLTIDGWDFNGSRPGHDHLKIIDDYIRSFSVNLEKVSFTWNGLPGPCPFTLFTTPPFAPNVRKVGKLFAEVTSPMSPLPAAPTKGDMLFPKLRYMQVRNCLMRAPQVANLVYTHRHTVKEYDFEKVSLLDGGTWDEALEPLKRMTGAEAWRTARTDSALGSSIAGDEDRAGTSHSDPDSAIDMTNPWNSSPDQIPQEVVEDTKSVVSANLKKRRVRRRRKVKPDTRDEAPACLARPARPTTPPIDKVPDLTSSTTLSSRPGLPSPHLGMSSVTMSASTVFTHRQSPSTPKLGSPASPKSSTFPPYLHNSSILFAEVPRYAPSPLPLLQPKTFVPQPLNADIQGCQRDPLLDAAHQQLADDADRRVSTLKKAREAVLTRLGTQFSKQRNSPAGGSGSREVPRAFWSRKVGPMGMGAAPVEKGSQLVPLMIFR